MLLNSRRSQDVARCTGPGAAEAKGTRAPSLQLLHPAPIASTGIGSRTRQLKPTSRLGPGRSDTDTVRNGQSARKAKLQSERVTSARALLQVVCKELPTIKSQARLAGDQHGREIVR